ncbi:MAG: MFS transporter [Chloroflexi bacterium]|nr:MFS transporter [Chloroflexota bacterium]
MAGGPPGGGHGGSGGPGGPQRPRGFSIRTFESLKHRGFRWFFLASLAAMASLNMQILVRGFLAFELTSSFSALGAMGIASATPMFTLSVFGGVLADRVSKKRIMQVSQTISGVLAIGIGLLVLSGQLRYEHLFITSIVQGVVQAMMLPASQAMVPEVIGRQGMMNAISLNAAGMNFVRLLAPAAGGLLIALIGAASVYFLMAGTYALAVVLLVPVSAASALRPQRLVALISHAGMAQDTPPANGAGPGGPAGPPMRRGPAEGGVGAAIRAGFADLGEGGRYIWRDRNIFQLLTVNFLTAMLGMPFMVMLPGYVAEVYGGGADALGLIVGVSGAGALAGALVVASLPEKRRGVLMLLSAALIGASLMAFVSTDSYLLGCLFMATAGVGTAGRQALSAVLVQTHVEDEYRGRVMAVFMTQISLMLGAAFFVGLFAEVVGVRPALGILGAVLVVMIAAFLAFSPTLRRMT